MNLLIISCMIMFVCVFSGIYFSFLWKPKDAKKEEEESGKKLPLFTMTAVPAAFFELLGFGKLYRFVMSGSYRKMKDALSYCNVDLTPERVFCTQIGLTVLLALVGGGITAMLTTEENWMIIPIVMIVGALVGWFIPGVQIGNLVQEREVGILRALPFSIDLIGSAMRGGLDFTAAIRFYVSLGVEGPLTDEFRQMLREMELGVIRTTALLNMAERIRLKDFTAFAESVVLGMEFGAPLSETMEIQGEEMRKLRYALAECKAQRAPSLMLFPMALFIMPAVFIIILTPVFLKFKGVGV